MNLYGTPESDLVEEIVMSQASERWRDVIGYEGLYQVSDQGRVKSLGRIDLLGRRWKERKLKPGIKRGHLSVVLYKKGIRYQTYVHRLVLEAFVGPCPEGQECRHFPDRDPVNNRLENLQWSSHKENLADMKVHETTARGDKNGSRTHPEKRPRGEEVHQAKLTEDDVRKIRSATETQREIASQFGVSQANVSDIKRGEIWKHVSP